MSRWMIAITVSILVLCGLLIVAPYLFASDAPAARTLRPLQCTPGFASASHPPSSENFTRRTQ